MTPAFNILTPPFAIYSEYEKQYWYYEIFVLVKKMLLTGAMCVIAAGSLAQILLAILIVIFFMLTVFKLVSFRTPGPFFCFGVNFSTF